MGCCGKTDRHEVAQPKSSGPLSLRGRVCCTDIIVLILFIAFWGFMGYIAVYSLIHGDGRRLLFGYDSFGNTCNRENNQKIANLSNSGKNTSGKPYVFFMSVDHPLDALQICVSECPTKDLDDMDEVIKYYKETNVSYCDYKNTPDNKNLQFTRKGPCSELPIYKSIRVVFRCVPDPTVLVAGNGSRATMARKFFDIIELDDLFRKALSDIYICWKHMLALCGLAIVIAGVMVVLIRFLAAIIVWLIVILSSLGSIAGTGVLWWVYYDVKFNGKQYINEFHIPVLNMDINNEKAFLIFAITASVVTVSVFLTLFNPHLALERKTHSVILLLILLILRKRISLVVALFHEAGKCVIDMPLLLLQPLWTFIAIFIFVSYWVVIQAYVTTLGSPEVDYKEGFARVKYVTGPLANSMWWIHVVGLIWMIEFLLACQQYVIAGSVSTWYFTVNKKRLSCPIMGSVCTLTAHHIGSVAFGSLIITLLKIPRYILMYIQKKCEGSQNACAQCCLKCCICCLYCLEKLMKFINQNAYTIIAITGKNFCYAAQKAFSILTSNVLRVAAINSVGAFVLFLGKVGVMSATCVVSVFWLRTIDELHYFAIPVFLLSIFAFIIAHCFLSVYEMVVDALLLCFCEDCQLNDGSPGREYYMSTSLMKFVKDSSSRYEQMNRKQAARRHADEVDVSARATELQPIATRT